jgi:UDP-GlcNAc3NAcA epimerase
MKVVTVVGARPQFIKAFAVQKALEDHNRAGPGAVVQDVLVHTGQHYDYEMSDVFFLELGLRTPDHHLGVGSGSHATQTAGILRGVEEILQRERPDWVLVYGDTNSTLGGALAASKLGIPVAHVEAGLRSFNRQGPEEINRVVTDHLSSALFCPTQVSRRNLEAEGIERGVFVIGDVMFDTLAQCLQIARAKRDLLGDLELEPKRYALATVHRAENTDNRRRLEGIVRALSEIGSALPVAWPIHPRTRKILDSSTLGPGLRCMPPVSYFDMLILEASASVVLTDSGGVQKEAAWLGVPCVTLRDETEWVETLEEGRNILAGAGTGRIVDAFRKARNTTVSPVVVDSGASRRLVAALVNNLAAEACSDGLRAGRPEASSVSLPT